MNYFYTYFEKAGFHIVARVLFTDKRKGNVRDFYIKYAFCSPEDTYDPLKALALSFFDEEDIVEDGKVLGTTMNLDGVGYIQPFVERLVQRVYPMAPNCPHTLRKQ